MADLCEAGNEPSGSLKAISLLYRVFHPTPYIVNTLRYGILVFGKRRSYSATACKTMSTIQEETRRAAVADVGGSLFLFWIVLVDVLVFTRSRVQRGIGLRFFIISPSYDSELEGHYKSLIGEEQNSFRKGRSCADGYFTLKILIEKHREFNKETHLAFIDYEIVFDSVDRNKPFQILADDSVPNTIIRTIYELYNHNTIKITIGSEHTEWRPINCGVRQGCPLSPLLFNIYINSIIRHWRLTIHGNIPLYRNCTLDTLLYADDQVLFATNEDELQYSIYHLNIIAQNFNMKISQNKTKIMTFQGAAERTVKNYVVSVKCVVSVKMYVVSVKCAVVSQKKCKILEDSRGENVIVRLATV
ncbi:hypothetical protein ANN_09190 [Periplaneta americana]|uniref:Reverse transcriptase domain-containing protein n=1 Tax=Periplaneta americana TaxID=6978 RepID=A0ABQ8TKP3_PERAM|nr:hypothetical protein ANN_09190 [Periplaneta americana]